MRLVCPECKNEVDLSSYPNLQEKDVVECNVCGITLLITAIVDGGEIQAEVVDEGK